MRDRSIAYCGVPGSFSHVMAVRHFGKDNIFVGTLRPEDIFTLMEQREAQFGVVALENNWMGPIREIFDLLLKNNVQIVGDEYLTVVHNLVGIRVKSKTSEERIKQVRKVLSHPKSLEQCRPFLDLHPYMEPTVFSDTGRAAQYVADLGDPKVAAIAGIEAAKIYNLDILSAGVQASSSNITRFAYLCAETCQDYPPNKSSIIVTLAHTPGQLYRVLEVLARDQCNLTWIEQRCVSDLEVVVFVDFKFPESHFREIGRTFDDIQRVAKTLRILGVYHSRQADIVH